MNFEEIGRVWRDDVTGEFRRRRMESLSPARDRAARFEARARRYWWFGTVGAIVAVPYFAFFAVLGVSRGYLVSALGMVVVATSVASLAIQWRKLRGGQPDSALPVSEAVKAQVACLVAWERYKNTIGRWYLAPLVAGVVVTMAGMSVNMSGEPVSLGLRIRLPVYAIVASMLLELYNRRDARLRVRPLRKDLESWLSGLRDSEVEGI